MPVIRATNSSFAQQPAYDTAGQTQQPAAQQQPDRLSPSQVLSGLIGDTSPAGGTPSGSLGWSKTWSGSLSPSTPYIANAAAYADTQGVHAYANAGAYRYNVGQDGTLNLPEGNSVGYQGDAQLGAGVGGDGNLTFNPLKGNLGADGSVGGFIGAKGEGSVTLGTSAFSVTETADAGAGAGAQAQGEIGFHDGKLTLDGGVQGYLGAGVGDNLSLSVNFSQLNHDVSNAEDSAGRAAVRGAEDAAKATAHGLDDAAKTVRRDVDNTAKTVHRDADKTADTVRRDADNTADTVRRAADTAADTAHRDVDNAARTVVRDADTGAKIVASDADKGLKAVAHGVEDAVGKTPVRLAENAVKTAEKEVVKPAAHAVDDVAKTAAHGLKDLAHGAGSVIKSITSLF